MTTKKTQAKHTPGPWNTRIVSESYRYPDGEYAGPRPVLVIGVPENNGLKYAPEIAATAREIVRLNDGPDARLIAAAPDLLEAAKSVSLEAAKLEADSPALARLRAAIAKAEGN